MLILLSLLSCRPADPPPLNVVLVVIDGIRVDDGFSPEISELSGEAGSENLPAIHQYLVPQGTLLRGARNYGTTTTAPAHAILMTGHRTPLANFANDFGAGSYRPTRPTWIEALRAAQGGQAMLVANQSLIEPVTWSLHPEGGQALGAEFAFVPEEPGSIQPAGDDTPVFAQLERLLEQHPRLVMVNLKAVDRSGHYGQDSEEYLGTIRAVDLPLVRLWERLQLDPFYADNTLLIITSDHGRHRERQGDGEYWRNHGDPGAGDRDVPILILGPGVRQDLVLEEPWALQDIAPTIAELAGVPLPWASGLPIASALVKAPTGPTRQGVAAAAMAQTQVQQLWLPDPAHRSQVLAGDTVLSDPMAWAAEDPSSLDLGARTWSCWRELQDYGETLPWVPRCALLDQDQIVQELPGPEPEVSPFWHPAMGIDAQDRLCLSYVNNPDDIASAGVDDLVAVHHACLQDGQWLVGVNTDPTLRYPELGSALLLEDGQVLLPVIGSPPSNEAREQRRLYLQRGNWQGQDWIFQGTTRLDLSDAQPLTGTWRLAHPVITRQGQELALLVLARGAESTAVLELRSQDDGQSWAGPTVLASSPSIGLDLPPAWVKGQAHWIQDQALCTPQGCQDMGARILSWSDDGQELLLVLETEPGLWDTLRL